MAFLFKLGSQEQTGSDLESTTPSEAIPVATVRPLTSDTQAPVLPESTRRQVDAATPLPRERGFAEVHPLRSAADGDQKNCADVSAPAASASKDWNRLVNF